MKIVVMPSDSELRSMIRSSPVGKIIAEVGLANTANRITQEWAKAIRTKVTKQKGWGERYIDSFQIVRPSQFRLQITAGGPATMYVEHGIRRFDMKKSLEPGEYRVIPFRHFTPGTLQRSAMPETIYKEMQRQLKQGRKSLTGIPMTRAEKRKGYTASIYEGMRRYGAKGHYQYMTFRIMSFKGQSSKWWYPEIPARPIFPTIAKSSQKWLDQEFGKVLVKLGATVLRNIMDNARKKGARRG